MGNTREQRWEAGAIARDYLYFVEEQVSIRFDSEKAHGQRGGRETDHSWASNTIRGVDEQNTKRFDDTVARRYEVDSKDAPLLKAGPQSLPGT